MAALNRLLSHPTARVHQRCKTASGKKTTNLIIQHRLKLNELDTTGNFTIIKKTNPVNAG